MADRSRRTVAPTVTSRSKSERVILMSHGLVVANLKGSNQEKNKDVAYQATSKVADLASQWVMFGGKQAHDREIGAYRICLPVVVIEGNLFRARFDPTTRSLSAIQVDFGHVLANARNTPTRVDVCTLNGFGSYLDAIEPRIEQWARRLAAKSPLAI